MLRESWAKASSEERACVHMAKRRGERGSPCLKPQEGLKVRVDLPLTRTEYWTVVTHSLMRRIQCSENLHLIRHCSKKDQLILSKALLMSILIATRGNFFLLESLM